MVMAIPVVSLRRFSTWRHRLSFSICWQSYFNFLLEWKVCSNICFLAHLSRLSRTNQTFLAYGLRRRRVGVLLSLPLFLFRRVPFLSLVFPLFSLCFFIFIFYFFSWHALIILDIPSTSTNFCFIVCFHSIRVYCFIRFVYSFLPLLQGYDPIIYVQQRLLPPTYIPNPRPYENEIK